MTRAEHLLWCKTRALALVDAGDLEGAVASMTSDLMKHPETTTPHLPVLSMAGMMDVTRGGDAVRHWVEGFQ